MLCQTLDIQGRGGIQTQLAPDLTGDGVGFCLESSPHRDLILFPHALVGGLDQLVECVGCLGGQLGITLEVCGNHRQRARRGLGFVAAHEAVCAQAGPTSPVPPSCPHPGADPEPFGSGSRHLFELPERPASMCSVVISVRHPAQRRTPRLRNAPFLVYRVRRWVHSL